MNQKWIRILLSVTFMVVLLFTTGSAVADSSSDPQGNWLFKAAQAAAELDFANDPTIARNRFVSVNLSLVHRAEVGDQLVLNFFEDVSFTAILDRKGAGAEGGYTWTGHLEGVPLGTFALAIMDGQMAGNVSTPEGAYAIRFAGNGVHALQQIDQTKFPAEAEPLLVDLPQEAIEAAADQPMLDDGSVIDVLVAWTPAAETAAGGSVAIQNLVNLAVTEANQSYINSGINPQLNLVAMGSVAYTESGSMSTDLGRLQNPSDGYMDFIHGVRDTYYADQVALIVESSEYCGIAYMMSTVTTAFEANAFSVVARNCATGYYSYAHELGHNQGARHDWYVDDSLNAPYSYDKGFIYIPGQWRTIMAYNNECADAGIYCTRLQYWSNPDVLYGGVPMGVPIGTSTSCTTGVHPNCDADNRTTLNNTAWTVANFRDRGASTIGPLVYDGHTVDDDDLGNSSGNDNGIVDCGENIELYTTLWNQGVDPATSVNATISTSDPYVTFLFNTSSSYPDIPGDSTGVNTDDYDFSVNPGTPHGHVIHFDLDISAASGGPWSDSFDVPVSCVAAFPEIEVSPPSFTVNLNVGETTTEILTIENLGGAPLEFDIYDVETGTPDILSDSTRRRNDGLVSSSDDLEAFSNVKTGFQVSPGAALELNRKDGDIATTEEPEAFANLKTEAQILASNPVLIIQDLLPWGYASIQDILTAHAIGYDLVDSTAIATIDLSPYRMVIIPSVQGDAFYTTFNAYLYKFENYVSNGGMLWQSSCNHTGSIEPLAPGGVVSATDEDYFNVLIEPGHPWVAGVPSPFEGSWANHDSFDPVSLYPGSTVVATTQTSGNPTLVDYRYGAGRVLITGQTLEITWGLGWEGAPILENSLLDLYNTPTTWDVLIIQDTDPWYFTSTKDILNAHGISFNLADSSMIPSIDLAPYTMVIIPSVQGDTFYTTFNAYLYKFEDYVSNGGKLWQSTCNYSATPTEPLGPGGVISTNDNEDYNLLVEPGHPWVAGVPSPFYGTSANHSSLSNLYPGSMVVATTQISGNPTLVDYHYGVGRVLLTGQTLEYAWAMGQDGGPILENSLLDLYYDPLAADVLILQDVDPWGTTSTKDILNAHGIAFTLADSSSIPTINLAPYRMVIIPGVQGGSFYSTFNANIGKFEAYVNAGGRLWQSTCNYSGTTPEPLVPGGVVSATDTDNYNLILEPGHPWVTGIPSPFYGNYASHDSFSSLYPGSIVVASAQTSGNPTLVDYRYGAGMMLITGQTLEISWELGWDGAPILEYSLIDLYQRAAGPDATWLTENPVTGTIPPQDFWPIDVTFDATGLTPGTYTANIVIGNNDPDENPTIVPVTLNVGGCPGGPNLDYFTTQDNENNALTGTGDCDMDVYLFADDPLVPIEFNIFIPDPTGVNELMINAWDVDETGGEVDEVYFNDNYAGTLTGADATWSTTVLPMSPAWVVPGYNRVTILVDVLNQGWAVNVDWGQVNKSVSTAHIRYVDIGPPPYIAGTTMLIEVEVDTDLASQDLRTEVNLRDPGGVILDGQVIYHTVNGANNDPVQATLTIPAGELGPGYDIQVLVFDAPSSRFQDASLIGFEVSPTSQTQLWVDPVVKDIPFGGTDTVDLVISDVADLYGISLELDFDPAIVEVVSITPGSCPSPDFIVQKTFDNTLGKIYYDVISLSPSVPCTGTGVIATIEFSGKIIDVSELRYINWLLTDKNGFSIPVMVIHNGELNVVFVHGFVNGTIQMQGRTDHSGAEVCAWDGLTLIDCTTTFADGSYELALLPGTYDIMVEMGRYLDSEYLGVSVVSGSPTTLPTVVLPGGDGNDDDIINILDLSFMAARYLCSIGDPCYDPRGDINNDGIINIQDLSIAGGNYRETSPVPWP